MTFYINDLVTFTEEILNGKPYFLCSMSRCIDFKMSYGNYNKCAKTMFSFDHFHATAQLTFTCSKSTIETLEKGVKYVQN